MRLSSDTAVWGQVTHTLIRKPSIHWVTKLDMVEMFLQSASGTLWGTDICSHFPKAPSFPRGAKNGFYLLVGLGVWDEPGRLHGH